MIQFLLNNEMIELKSFAPSLSILDWLRTNMGRAGSKEGCASGDCGACTVVVGDLINDQWQYKSINACLMLVGNLHGKHLITVEALTTKVDPKLEDLHPVQRAMVECHGSQCGFCTPGFIMSLFALYMNHNQYPGKEAVIQALGGNLCRCTGYQPILKAAEKCFSYPQQAAQNISHQDHRFSQQVRVLTETLKKALLANQIPMLEDGDQHFYLPQNLSQLCALKASHPQAQFVAGATDLSVEFSQRLSYNNKLISVRYCPELMQFNEDQQGLHIGAALPYSEFLERFCEIYPESHELFERLGSLQIRNAGSLGGSIANASPIGDPAPLFIALNASIELQSCRGQRVIALADFFVDYRKTQLADDEVIVAIHIPKRDASLQLSCHKISKRIEDDISAVCLVLSYQLDNDKMHNVRCAMGGMAATPALAKNVAKALNGQILSLENLQHAAQQIDVDFQPLSDVRASSAYRLQVSKNLFDRIWFQALGKIQIKQNTQVNTAIQTRIHHEAL
ncbi:xanthine dehydrogenase small subunit [Psychromonas sp. SR45-3]|uniref:xanthine dehydrogenase small subunit n=1 Tax=Psychromonas sp. SR45-3 TaxID=2760930 RepID=UPI002873F05C|nr:xanthine dehydrogenase small subunit [Psychromonas sp. SR45-3]